MKIFFEQGTPAPLRMALSGREVNTAFECGWDRLENGALLSTAENGGFEVFITTDQNLRYQQNLVQRRIAGIVLSTTNWLRIRGHVQRVSEALENIGPGAFVEVSIP